MYADRLPLYRKLEEMRGSKVLAYITGDRPGLQTQISQEVVDFFTDHLDNFTLPIPKISLYLYSCGGNALSAWAIVNLIRIFCDDFEVIIPSKALSGATLISIGADRIIMTKQATLGPIDPSVNSPFNPPAQVQGQNIPLSISVEAVGGYFDMARNELANGADLTQVFLKLADKVHPIALGSVYRSREQIKMLARRLLENNIKEKSDVDKVIAFLCSESGSHDYTINRREAKNQLKLPVEIPDEALYSIIKSIHMDMREEMELNSAFDKKATLGTESVKDYTFVRALVESIPGGSHKYLSQGRLIRTQVSVPQNPKNPIAIDLPGIQHEKHFEGWKHEPAAS